MPAILISKGLEFAQPFLDFNDIVFQLLRNRNSYKEAHKMPLAGRDKKVSAGLASRESGGMIGKNIWAAAKSGRVKEPDKRFCNIFFHSIIQDFRGD